jgi:hypothetical protein
MPDVFKIINSHKIQKYVQISFRRLVNYKCTGSSGEITFKALEKFPNYFTYPGNHIS